MVLLSLFYVLLAKLSGQEEIIVGSPIAGRKHSDLEPILGMFVNSLALRNYPRGEKTAGELLKEVKTKVLKAFENQDYPFEYLAAKVMADRDSNRNPLFDVMFAFQNLDITEVEIPGLQMKPFGYKHVTSKFDLTLTGEERGDTYYFIFEYRTKLFKEETIKEFAGYFKDITAAVLENRDIKLSDINIDIQLSDSESSSYREAYGEFEL